MTARHRFVVPAIAAALLLAACSGGGNSPIAAQSGAGAQSAGYVPQSAAMAGAAADAAAQAFPKPLPDALIALGAPANAPDLTKPIINDVGAYTNGPIIAGTNTTKGYGIEGIGEGAGAGVYGHSSYNGSGGSAYGVYGYASNGSGVYGYAGTYGRGVYGASESTATASKARPTTRVRSAAISSTTRAERPSTRRRAAPQSTGRTRTANFKPHHRHTTSAYEQGENAGVEGVGQQQHDVRRGLSRRTTASRPSRTTAAYGVYAGGGGTGVYAKAGAGIGV